MTSEQKEIWGCCHHCQDRFVGCHNVETCERWKKHEELKAYFSKQKEKRSAEKDFEYTVKKVRDRYCDLQARKRTMR